MPVALPSPGHRRAATVRGKRDDGQPRIADRVGEVNLEGRKVAVPRIHGYFGIETDVLARPAAEEKRRLVRELDFTGVGALVLSVAVRLDVAHLRDERGVQGRGNGQIIGLDIVVVLGDHALQRESRGLELAAEGVKDRVVLEMARRARLGGLARKARCCLRGGAPDGHPCRRHY